MINYPNGPVCARISCSKDEIPGACTNDIAANNFPEFLKRAIEWSQTLKSIGPADKIELIACSLTELYCCPLHESQKLRDKKTVRTWIKIDNEWRVESDSAKFTHLISPEINMVMR